MGREHPWNGRRESVKTGRGAPDYISRFWAAR